MPIASLIAIESNAALALPAALAVAAPIAASPRSPPASPSSKKKKLKVAVPPSDLDEDASPPTKNKKNIVGKPLRSSRLVVGLTSISRSLLRS
jgi:hypothetical protein